MYMTLETNYAIKIVEALSENCEKMDARTISEKSKVPQRFALKILRELVTDDIVESFKGVKGGYKLAKPPSQITLRDVIASVDGDFVLSRCQEDEYQCNNKDCKLHNIYEEISEYVRQKLDSYNFEDICCKKSCEADENLK
jgi:Rrf2 family protein